MGDDWQGGGDDVLLRVEAIAAAVGGDGGEAQAGDAGALDEVRGGARAADLVEDEDHRVGAGRVRGAQRGGEHLAGGDGGGGLHVRVRAVLGAAGREPVAVPGGNRDSWRTRRFTRAARRSNARRRNDDSQQKQNRWQKSLH